MKPRHPFAVCFLAAALLPVPLGALGAPAAVVRGEPVSAAEAATLAPVCKLILIEKPNAHIDHVAQKKNAALFDRPEYRMAKNAIHLHHWCRAAVTRHRYFNASSPQKKRGYKTDFHDEIDYVIRNMGPTWPYTPMLLAEKGEMFLLDKKYPEASSQALNAIQLNPAFARAHVLLVNVYNAMGEKGKALEAATAGLRHNSDSATLKRMYDELGGVKPYPEPVAKPAQPAPPAETAAEVSTDLPPPSSGEFKAAGEEEAVSYPLRQPEDAAASDAAAAESPSGQKKYCRFCP